MLVKSSLDEVKRRETALKLVSRLVREEGRPSLYDLTGLSGGFPLNEADLGLLETYAGPALFEEDLQLWGRKHLAGDKILALNRTSSGILATILALISKGDEVYHYLPYKPSHPSIPRSTALVGATYRESDMGEEITFTPQTRLLIITGSTMDHQVLPLDKFREAIHAAQNQGVIVLVDDASGARLRTIVYQQPRAMDMGADLVVTSTDKLMDGPRGGLISGKAEYMDLIKDKAHQFGLEAQPPLIAGMVRALEKFNPNKLLEAVERKNNYYELLKGEFSQLKETPTGIMLTPEGLKEELRQREVNTSLSDDEAAILFAMLLLKHQHILTIPAVGMPGASATIRWDLAAHDAERISPAHLLQSLQETMKEFINICGDNKACHEVLYH